MKEKRQTIRKWQVRAIAAAGLVSATSVVLLLIFPAILAVMAVVISPVGASAQVAVIANGSPITELDIRQRMKLMATSSRKTPTRQEVINELIDDRLKIAKARAYGVEVSDAEVDAAFNNMAQRQHVSAQQFAQVLERGGISANTVKARIRAELTWSQLVRGRYSTSLQVGDADIAKALAASNETENAVGYIYTLYPITVIIPNGASPGVAEAKRNEAEQLRGRFVSCKTGLPVARALRDVAVREPISKSSADLPEQLRDILAKLEVGHLSAPDTTAQGLQMFAVCDKRTSSTDSPAKKEARDKIFASRFEAESKKFLDEIRRSAMIEYK